MNYNESTCYVYMQREKKNRMTTETTHLIQLSDLLSK